MSMMLVVENQSSTSLSSTSSSLGFIEQSTSYSPIANHLTDMTNVATGSDDAGNISDPGFGEPDKEYIYFKDNSRFWVQRVLVPIIMIIGIIGNTITMIIMTRRRMRSSTNWYLAALATFDMIYLIFTFILSLKHYPNAHSTDYYYYWYMFPYCTMIADASSNTSVWLTVTFTIERYIAVCHPIKGKVICTESRAKRVIFCVFIICLSVTLPTPFEWVVFERLNEKTDQMQMSVEFSELGKNVTYKNIYYHLTVLLFVLIPLILLVIFNSFLIRSVHISNKQRSRMVMGKDKFHKSSNKSVSNVSKNVSNNNNNNNNTNNSRKVPSPTPTPTTTQPSSISTSTSTSSSSSRQEIRITVMLIAVVILFILCQTPTAFILVYTAFHQPKPDSNEECLLIGLNNIFNFLMSINSAGNFVLYCLLSQKYRRTFVKMFCPCWTHGRSHGGPGFHNEYSTAVTGISQSKFISSFDHKIKRNIHHNINSSSKSNNNKNVGHDTTSTSTTTANHLKFTSTSSNEDNSSSAAVSPEITNRLNNNNHHHDEKQHQKQSQHVHYEMDRLQQQKLKIESALLSPIDNSPTNSSRSYRDSSD